MARPTLITVDDDPHVLRAVQRDLRERYGDDYRVLAAGSGAEALELIEELRLRNEEVALLLADQRMPGMTGVELIEAAAQHYPRAKRALLTAYADTDVAIRAINTTGLHQYITKPWDPPEERLYPTLDDLLEDWAAEYRPPFEGVRVVAGSWSRAAHELKDFLTRNQVPYEFIDAGGDEGHDLMELAGVDVAALPLVLLPDGTPVEEATPASFAEHVGLSTHAELPSYDLAIIGGGPAGLAAAVYGASEGLKTLLVERQAPGGQAGRSSLIENYLGFPSGLSGGDLARRAAAQARRFGAELLVPQEAVGVQRNDPFRKLRLGDGSEVNCKAMLITTGVNYRTLPVDGADELTGAGLYYSASRIEATTHEGEDVFVIGGGNSAGQAALFLAGYARTVTILIRSQPLTRTMSRYLIDNIETADNITVRERVQVVSVDAEGGRLSGVTIEDIDSGTRKEMDAGALFVFIGQAPWTEWVADLLECDEDGFILSGTDCLDEGGWPLDRPRFPLETSVPGVFVAGDVRHGSVKRVASATGEGAMAVRFVHEHLGSL